MPEGRTTKKELERALRAGGFSRTQAKRVVHEVGRLAPAAFKEPETKSPGLLAAMVGMLHRRW